MIWQILQAQVRDTPNSGVQFGQPLNLSFGNFGSEITGSIDSMKPQQPTELEHQTSSQHVGSAPSNQGMGDVFQGTGGPNPVTGNAHLCWMLFAAQGLLATQLPRLNYISLTQRGSQYRTPEFTLWPCLTVELM